MILRKKAVAVAIAGIAAAPLTVSAETTISGIMELQIRGTSIGSFSDNASDVADSVGDDISDAVDDLQDQDVDDDDEVDDELADDATEDVSIGAGDVRVNITSIHDLNNGLQGYGNIGFQLDDLSAEQGGQKGGDPSVTPNNIYAGIKGGFGDIRIGEGPNTTEYGQVANDIFDVVPEDLSDAISYTGAFGPVTIGINYAFEAPLFGPDTDVISVGAKFALGGVTFSGGAGEYGSGELDVDDDRLIWSAGGAFAFAGASIALQYWSRENFDDLEDSTSIGGKIGYGFGDLSANFTYEVLMDDPDIGGEGVDEEAARLDLVYDLGGGTDISTRITSFTNDDDDSRERTEYRLQLAKSF